MKSQRSEISQARARAQGARAHIAESARGAHAYRARTRRSRHMTSLKQHVPGDLEGFLNPFWRQLLIEGIKGSRIEGEDIWESFLASLGLGLVSFRERISHFSLELGLGLG